MELQAAKDKYPWLKVDQALEALQRLDKDLPAIIKILMLQEKQNAIHRKYIEVSGIADTAITKAIMQKFNIQLDGPAA